MVSRVSPLLKFKSVLTTNVADICFVPESLTSKRLVEDKNLSQIQDQLGSSVGGVFGKGGIGHDLGAGLSKGL